MRVVNDASPHQVAVQFWKDGRQIFGQPFAFGGRQCLDGSFNFGNCAHPSEKITPARLSGKNGFKNQLVQAHVER